VAPAQFRGRPTEPSFAANPTMLQLVDREPAYRPYVNLVARCQQAQAEAEVSFRQSELKGHWAEWCGIYPWDEERNPDFH
jgi:hypothetical protein